MTTKCKKCDDYSKNCNCDIPEIVCTNCELPLIQCECDPAISPHKCETCNKWNAYEYHNGYICDRCMAHVPALNASGAAYPAPR
jgi:hypothetical protein